MHSRPRRLALALALVGVLQFHAAPQAEQPAAPVTTSAKRALEPADAMTWKSVGTTVLSDDGQWFGYRLAPGEGDAQIVLRQTGSEREWRFDIGDPQANAPVGDAAPAATSPTSVQFSENSKWAAFTTYPTRTEAQRLRRQRRPVETGAAVVNLETGTRRDYARVRRFVFTGDTSPWLALHRPIATPAGSGGAANSGTAAPSGAGAGGDEAPKGSDLILRDLTAGHELNVGNVADFAFRRDGRYLAFAIDARDKVGNGLQLRDMTSGAVRVLDSDAATFERITWTEKGDGLAVLKGKDDRALRDKRYVVLGYTNLDGGQPMSTTFDPAADTTFPPGMTISGNRDPRWSEDLQTLFFGIHEPRRREPAANETAGEGGSGAPASTPREPEAGSAVNADERVDLVLWHWQDGRLQTQQQVQEQRDRNASHLAGYRTGSRKFFRYADDSLRTVTPAPRDRWAIGTDDRDYELTGNLSGERVQDVYVVNLETGERRLAAKRVRWLHAPSPDGSSFLFYDDGDYHVHGMASGKTRNITRGVATSFVNSEDDHNVMKPPTGVIDWASDSQSVLLHDNWDIWQVPVAEGSATNLTGNGRREGIRYSTRFVLEPASERDKGLDLSKPLYFRAYGEWSKKGGIARVNGRSSGVQMLAWGDASYSRLARAKEAERFVYTRESVGEPADYVATDASFTPSLRLTDQRPQLASYEWSAGSMLIDYTSEKGDKLQAALFLPANYEKGKSYPTVVNFYERLSQTANTFAAPSANGFNRSVYTSQGYAVLVPDITYRVNDPGMSAVWCMVPAVKAAIATGIVDAKRVGITGHSWGGYQTAHLITQTDIFAAAVAGAPLTNMVSMYSLIYKNTGGGNGAIFESSQGRFKGGYWDNWDAYYRNSPVFFAKNVKTPLLLLHNDRDGAVDFTQGVEFYNTLRRLGKPVIMLEYVGENHNLRKPANQRDYSARMKEFFDHHLKGVAAPEWMTKGVPRMRMEDHLRERTQPKVPEKRPTTTSPQG